MQDAREEYRGYAIIVAPVRDKEDLWDFEYQLDPIGDKAGERRRAQSAGGHLTADAACLAGLEVARTEVDNLLALKQAGQR